MSKTQPSSIIVPGFICESVVGGSLLLLLHSAARSLLLLDRRTYRREPGGRGVVRQPHRGTRRRLGRRHLSVEAHLPLRDRRQRRHRVRSGSRTEYVPFGRNLSEVTEALGVALSRLCRRQEPEE
eukprot:scaffold117373_cov33-Phaeocystis_antarctica.AAC.1